MKTLQRAARAAAAVSLATICASVNAQSAPDTSKTPPPIVFSGNLDGYYGYNFNRPARVDGLSPTGPGLRNFDYKNQQFALGLAELTVSRATTDFSHLGFTIKLAYGPTVDLLTSAKDSDNKNILQAYVTYTAPFGKTTATIDAGKFVTHMGQEVIEPGSNWNYSRSNLFQYFIPYYHGGIRASIPLSPTVTGGLYLTNGWNNVSFDTNSSPAYGFSLASTPNADTSFIVNGITSNEPSGLRDQPKTSLEFIANKNLTKALSAALDFNYDFGSGTLASAPAVPDSKWTAYGLALYLKYGFQNGSYLAVRGEYARDKDGFIFGVPDNQAREITLTYSAKHALFPDSEFRIEYRYDSAGQDGLFVAHDGTTTKRTQQTISISQIFHF